MNFERKTLPRQHYLYVDRTAAITAKDIGDAMTSGFSELFGFVASKSVTPLSMPIAVYMEMPTDNVMRFRAGVFVNADDAKRAEGDVKAGVMPAGEAFTATHVGPYASLNQTHRALWDHMTDQGVVKAMPVWEVYIDDPTKTPEAQLRTEIYRAI